MFIPLMFIFFSVGGKEKGRSMPTAAMERSSVQ